MAAGGKAAIMSRWNMKPSGRKPDGKPMLRFKAQFKWTNDVLMTIKLNGKELPKRVVVQMRTRYGVEHVDILGWSEWRYEGGVLTLEDVLHGEAKPVK